MPPSTPPPKPPPAGWYPDPDREGLRWWDGKGWTEHFSASSAAAPSAQRPDGQDRRPSRRTRAVLLAVAVLAVLGGVAVARSLSSSDPLAAYAECQRDVQPVFTGLQDLGSHLDVGLVQSDYTAEVGDVKATYDRLTERSPAASCQPVVQSLGEAITAYSEASGECFYEEECEGEGVQELWLSADRAVARAKQQLDSLSGGAGAVAAAESEAAQIEADALAKEQIHAAQVAIETYATDHEGSYEGATPAKLRAIEPTLPSSLEVREAGLEYFSLSVASKGSNWFEVDREVLGELAYKCGEPGKAGCPVGGEWG